MRKKTVYDLIVKQRDELNLSLITNFELDVLKKKPLSKMITRPGLALTGFFPHFEPDRIQLLGETELLYLQSIKNNREKIKHIENYFSFDLPLIIVSKKKSIPQFFINLGNENKIPIIVSDLNTDELYSKLKQFLDEELSITVIVPASLISVYNVGILIEGNEGYGKSETSLELIKNGHQFVCDDDVLIKNKNGVLIGEAARDREGKRIYPLKIKGIGEIEIEDVFGVKSILEKKEIHLRVIFSKDDYDYIEDKYKFDFKNELEPLLGVKIPVVNINVSTNRSIATLIEMIAIQYLSKFKR